MIIGAWSRIRRQIAVLHIGLLPGVLFLGLITAGRLAGAFQLLEWQALDVFLRSRAPETLDERILLVSIDEQTIQAAGTYPIPDQQLASLLRTLQPHQPRVIGLDLYRDLPVEPGYLELAAVFQEMENLIGIERVSPPTVAPPPALPPDRVGFADATLDQDGHQRRMILGMQTDQGFRFSLALLLAQTYLAEENILLENGLRDPSTMRFGEAELPRIRSNFGAYVGANAGGGDVQVLLNFRQGRNAFRVVTFQDVLSGNFNPNWVRDRIVLIGVTAPSVQDYFVVSTSSVIDPETNWAYGVEIQIHAVSQIVSAALDRRPLIKSWPELGEYLWIISWGVIGIGFVGYARSPLHSLLGVSIGVVGVASISYLALMAGWWIPFIPTVTSLLLNSLGLAAFYQYARVIQTKIQAQQQIVSLLEQAKSDLEIKVAERTAELQQSNIELSQAKEAAETASRAKSKFLAHMSHELKSPLNAILGFSQLMARNNTLSTANQERIRLINHSGEHLLGLINDILTLVKLESEKQVVHEALFDLAALIETIEALFRLRIEQKGLQFLIEVSPVIPQQLVGDAQKLRQVLINLLSNALKFTQSGCIALRVCGLLHQDTVYLQFEVEDTGEGIAASELHKLFVPFVQTKSGEKAKTGTGLGLPISKQLVRLMEGNIQVSSQVGKGTLFSFTARVQAASAEKSAVIHSESLAPLPDVDQGLLLQDKDPDQVSDRLSSDSAATIALSSDAILRGRDSAIASALNSMPSDWLSELRQAALRLNGRRVMRLLEDLSLAQANAAKHLMDLAEDYEYAKIAQLVEGLLKEHGGIGG